MHQIADWLKSLGMSEYERRFVESRIDLSVLRDLTDQDLEKLGVLLGDRRKILRAIASLDQVSSSSTASVPRLSEHSESAANPLQAGAQGIGQRRHATVVFCDLVDSTGLATRLDIEEWRELVADLHRCSLRGDCRDGWQDPQKNGGWIDGRVWLPLGARKRR